MMDDSKVARQRLKRSFKLWGAWPVPRTRLIMPSVSHAKLPAGFGERQQVRRKYALLLLIF